MTALMIEASNLTKRYGDLTAVENLSLTVRAGELLALLGPNGAGKTTAIEMMEGLRQPDSGQCKICGFDAIKEGSRVRERIGITLQRTSMSDDVTAAELLDLYGSFYANPLPTADLLAKFHLTEKAKVFPRFLSGGQRQRLALALALVGRPEVLFLDEPTAGLDPQSRHALWDVIRELKAEGRAIVLTTHFMDEAEKLADHVAVIDRGQLLAYGTPQALMREHGPERALELDLGGYAADLAELSRLDAVTGVKSENGLVVLHTANTAATMLSLAAYAQKVGLPLNDFRTRTATLEDVFIALTGRGLRD